METTAPSTERLRRLDAVMLAAPAVILTLLALLGSALMLVSLLEKLDWWETEDWALPSFLLLGIAWPGALIAYAVARRLVVRAAPGVDRPAVVRALGLPFLLAPIFVVIAWATPFEPSHNTPDPLERIGRLTQLADYAAIALTIALWGWIVPRATLRGQLRAATIATAAVVALGVVRSLSGLGFFAPPAIACAIAWLTTLREG